MTIPSSQNSPLTTDVGILGEELVSRWVEKQGWVIVARRWRCRFGELDLVLARRSCLPQDPEKIESVSFVEVKTRRRKNWDEDGKLAVNSQKQAKLWKTAQLFLLQHPEFAELPCQFDVAIVACERLSRGVSAPIPVDEPVLTLNGYQLKLLEYIPAAFSQM